MAIMGSTELRVLQAFNHSRDRSAEPTGAPLRQCVYSLTLANQLCRTKPPLAAFSLICLIQLGLASCALETTPRLIDFVIIPYHDPNEAYNQKKKSIDSCEQRDCGSPISVFYSDGTIQNIQTSGGRGRVLAISPNRQYVAISDIYGIQIVHDHNLDIHPKNEITDSVRGISINNEGNFMSMEHVGSREVDGKSGFASLITWSYNNDINSKIEVIDGNPIDCMGTLRIFSYGDEEDGRMHVYSFDQERGCFNNIGNIDGIDNLTPMAHFCHADGSLSLYGSVNDLLGIATINELKLIYKSNEIAFDEIPTASHQSFTIANDTAYYASYPGNIHSIDIKSNQTTQSINVHNLISTPSDIEYTVVSLQDTTAFALTRDNNSKQWHASEINIPTSKVIKSSKNEYINKKYPDDEIAFLYIFNKERFSNWISSGK